MALDREFIRGRLERIYVTDRVNSTGSTIGAFQGNDVFVPTDMRHVNKNILARFDLKGDHNLSSPPRVNFVTSQIPQGFPGLPASEYVLCGVWNSYMKKSQDAPTFEELESYFEPGKKGWFYFLPNFRGEENESIKIDPFKQQEDNLSIERIIKKGLPYPQHYARVIIIEGYQQAEKALKEIKDNGVAPIMMEPLKKR